MKTLIIICTSLTLALLSFVNSWQSQQSEDIQNTYSSKESSFQILTTKCNSCHNRMNRKRVFTRANMDLWAKDVYEQVFVKQRMPKGKKNQLTTQEEQALINWISSVKK